MVSSLEEQIKGLGDIPARVIVLDDVPSELNWMLMALNAKGRHDNLGFVGTTSPSEAYKVLTEDSSILAAVGDVKFTELPSEEVAKFESGQAFAKKMNEARPDLFMVLMSVDKPVSRMLKDLPYVDHVWEGKDVSSIDDVYNKIKSGIPPPPAYSHLIGIVGGSGAGKSSILERIKRRLSYANVIVPFATRKPTRPTDFVNESLPPLYQRLVDNFITEEKMDERVEHSKDPLLWTREGYTTDKPGYFQLKRLGLLDKTDTYMLYGEAITMALKKGNVFVPIRTPQMINKFRQHFENSHFIVLHTDEASRERRMRQEGRTPEEILLRGMIEKDFEDLYLSMGDTIIDTNLDIEGVNGTSSQDYFRSRAIDHVFSRVSTVDERLRKTPHGVSAPEVHASYVRDAERDLCELFECDGNSLEARRSIKIPLKTVNDYHDYMKNAGADERFLGILERVSPSEIFKIETNNGVKSVHIIPKQMLDVPKETRDSEMWNGVAKGLLEYRLNETGFKFEPSESDKIHPHAHVSPSNEITYTLTDHGKPFVTHTLKLVFG